MLVAVVVLQYSCSDYGLNLTALQYN